MIGDLGVGTWGQPVHDPREPPFKLSCAEYFGIFGRTADDTRWIASADSQEYLALVSYLVQRSNARDQR